MRIVIVEDETPIRNGIGNTLKKINENYEVVGKAADGLEGLKIIRDQQPDLIIMDIRMPDMDGLTMLKKLRKEGNTCRAIVLSAYSEFSYAKQAIELGIENYLLKPIKIKELKNILEKIEADLQREQKNDPIVSVEKIFHIALQGQLRESNYWKAILSEHYQIEWNAPIGVFIVWLGEAYEQYEKTAEQLLKELMERHKNWDCSLHRMKQDQCFILLFYHIESGESAKNYIEKSILLMLNSDLNSKAVYGFDVTDGINNLHTVYKTIWDSLDWNLVLGENVLICPSELDEEKFDRFQYSFELENQIREAIKKEDEKELTKAINYFYRICKEKVYTPASIKETVIRCCWNIWNTAREFGNLNEEMSAKKMIEDITKSVTWDKITDIFKYTFRALTLERKESDTNFSVMVKKAQVMIQKYYSQGITLEEIARTLSVSEEYLSTTFKRETGMSFTETIRSYRIEQVKKLLRQSNLKLTQIAAMTGYSDPKYMSKVFKEQVGMLPAEYRKTNI